MEKGRSNFNRFSWSRRNVIGLLPLVAFGVALAGCNSKQASVNGRITKKDGSPVARARIVVRSTDTANLKSAYGITDTDGHFQLQAPESRDGMDPGVYSVIVIEDRGGLDGINPRTIAEKYERHDRSGLSLEVEQGKQQVFDFVLDPR